ncbi:hypothetical protein DDB_G0282551 [Dictyostelium discoideum AX4]|uniref:Uncharacterized protein n=1 Tax=Dictyostelium discoideum TaxID=44689 RepID=Q54SB9_DICDI|nr:hypothetical protein DDB_G0282551 [Dictyostelium discoideum AX4]EAL66135.1 hypothetical protein DDB_G0282551 [Dictyostelium discoideum AX4]|eukprot:XP_640120.1 hypothetical protein DDB_G0282551 [Dictyostelium discoideum AX4]
MTLISSISRIGSIHNGNSLNKTISVNSNNETKGITSSFGGNQSTNLINADIMANLLGILGIHIKAKVL